MVKPVCKLHKSLYGIKQAPLSWQSVLSSWLVSYDFCQSKTNLSLYTMIHDGHLFGLAVYVDDYLLIGKQSRKFLILFKHGFFLVSRLKVLVYLLGFWDATLFVTDLVALFT